MSTGERISSRQESAKKAVNLGLLVFAPSGQSFKTQKGQNKPYITDSRGAGTNLPLRKLVIRRLQKELASLPEFDVLASVVRAGTMWACWLAWEQNLPLANVLTKGPRESGLRREVEGMLQGQRVVLVDNWIRSGSSAKAAIEAVQRAKGVVTGILVIVKEGRSNIDIPVQSAWDLPELLKAAKDLGHMDPSL